MGSMHLTTPDIIYSSPENQIPDQTFGNDKIIRYVSVNPGAYIGDMVSIGQVGAIKCVTP
jgi:hypothetical protein